MAVSAENAQDQTAEAVIKTHCFLNALGSIQNCVSIQFIHKTCLVIPEMNCEADEDDKWMKLAKEEGLLPISLIPENLDPK